MKIDVSKVKAIINPASAITLTEDTAPTIEQRVTLLEDVVTEMVVEQNGQN